MKTFIILLLLLLLPTQIFAGETGPYFTGNMGVVYNQDISKDADLDVGGVPVAGSASANFKAGFTGGAGLGYYLGSNFRTEFDYTYRKANIKDLDLRANNATGSADAEGYVRAHAFLASLYKDINVGKSSAFYFGGGVGAAREILVVSKVDDEEADFFDESSWETAFQVSTGISTKISDGVSASLGYKYFKTLGEIKSHNIEVGVRFNMF